MSDPNLDTCPAPDPEYLDAVAELARVMPPPEVLARLTEENPPPQSWFDEDHSGLFGNPEESP